MPAGNGAAGGTGGGAAGAPALADWLKAHRLERYAPLFREHEIDLGTLAVLTESDLKELGLPFGPRKRLLSALDRLKRDQALPEAAAGTAERRQLTVLFCDMVGFTDLASRLDPEVVQTIMRHYEEVCTPCITRYEGYVFQRLGDGIVAFFGFPLAHEGEAERAVRAGLEILETLARRPAPQAGRLRVRIGIATGVVVVAPGGRSAVGEAMNLAARLQTMAEPDAIVVGGRVRRLAGGAFDYAGLGEREVKGFARPIPVYRVVGVSAAPSRFEAATRDGLTPLVGRERELERLLQEWRRAREGLGHAVLLSGEPGIGKSRVVNALREHPEAQGAAALRFQCSPYHVHSAFHPCIDHLERALGFERDEPPEARLDRLEAVLRAHGLPAEDVRFAAALLSLPGRERYGAAPLAPARRKEETIRVLVDLIEAGARVRPGLMLFEDAHWSDPTTLEVLDLLLGRIRRMPLLLVLTHRPEFTPRWSGRPHVTALPLAKLDRAQSGALVHGLSRGRALPPDLLDQIVRKTDGVPLFVEELTKTVLESGSLREDGGRYVAAGGPARITVPSTLRDSLMARLDRLASVKEIAQIGAAIGREFSYELMAAVAPLTEAELGDGLARLTEAELAFPRGTIPYAVYTFKHALVQEAAHDSLLLARRQELHARIARALEERWPGTKDTEPERLAQHYTAAGLAEAAVPYWRRAGELALQRFALTEAIAHLRQGLALVETLPPGAVRDRKELELRTALGPALVAVHGWAAPEVSGLLEPALSLARTLDHRESYLPVLHGLWIHFMSAGRHATAMGWAREMLAEARRGRDGDLEIVAHRTAMTSHFWMGDLLAARAEGDRIRAIYDFERHRHIAALTNNDPLTADGIYRSHLLWMLGHPDAAVAAAEVRDDHARRRSHPFDLGMALTLGAHVFDYRGEPEPLLRRVEEAERVGREHRIPLISEMMAQVVKGVAWLRAGRAAESIPQLREALARLTGTGHRAWIPYVRAVLAEALAQDGDLDRGLATLAESLEQIERQQERAHLAEVLRLRGWMLGRQGRRAEAEEALRAAIDVAREQQAKSWELRAATTLARLRADGGDPRSAQELLAPVYGWFTEGFGTRDLREARALLDALGGGAAETPAGGSGGRPT
jgi:class 3 adenylate cyclase/predicted ATPase